MEVSTVKNVGNHYKLPPQPPVLADTTFVDASAIKIGVEYRELDSEGFQEIYRGTEYEALALESDPQVDLAGVSLHVYDAQADVEYLRFDCFEGDSHYHYIHEWTTPDDVDNHVVHWDEVANGPMLPWAFERIRTRLPEMLAEAGAEHLSDKVDAQAISRAVDQVEEIVAGIDARETTASA
jgi:hypothetical protein